MKATLDFDLKSYRLARDWSQPEMAKFLGCSQAAVSRMEISGKVGVTYLKLLATLSPPFIITKTQDGTVIAFDPETGLSASGQTPDEAMAELRRLLTERDARIAELQNLLSQRQAA